MDGRGRCLDNVFIERLWRSLKYEAVYLHELSDGIEARRVIGGWIAYYNGLRPHSALKASPPPRSTAAPSITFPTDQLQADDNGRIPQASTGFSTGFRSSDYDCGCLTHILMNHTLASLRNCPTNRDTSDCMEQTSGREHVAGLRGRFPRGSAVRRRRTLSGWVTMKEMAEPAREPDYATKATSMCCARR